MQLKEFRQNENGMQLKYEDEKNHLELLLRKNQRVEQEVERYREREKYIQKVKILEMKRAWTVSYRLCFV